MKILIIGGGYAACCAAYVLTREGHECIVLEKDDKLGGMARTFYLDGLAYEYGPHFIDKYHSKVSTIRWLEKHFELVPTKVVAASFVEGVHIPFPPALESVFKLKSGLQIVREWFKRKPKKPDMTNFETYLTDIVGPTFYRIFYKEFTEKFWFVKATALSADWARLRHLGENLYPRIKYFSTPYCRYPKKDFGSIFETLSEHFAVKLNSEVVDINFRKATVKLKDKTNLEGDMIISTMRLDKLFKFQHGTLPFTGYRAEPKIVNREYYHPLDEDTGLHYGQVYYPEPKFSYCRITDFKAFNQKHNQSEWQGRTVVTIETPDKNYPFYPYLNENSIRQFNRYLRLASRYDKFITLGRLGLYKYMTFDNTTEQVFRFMKYVERWADLSPEKRYNAYQVIRGNWKN